MTSTKKTNEQRILAQLILHEPIKYLASAKARGGGKMRWVCMLYFGIRQLRELWDHTTVLTQYKAGMVSDPEGGRKDVVWW